MKDIGLQDRLQVFRTYCEMAWADGTIQSEESEMLKRKVNELQIPINAAKEIFNEIGSRLKKLAERTPKQHSEAEIRRKIFERCKLSVVSILTSTGHGSGFIVGSNLIVSNAHVTDGSTVVKIGYCDGREGEGYVLQEDPDLDLSLIYTETGDIPCMDFDNSMSHRVGDDIFAIGHPHGLGFTFTHGIVSTAERIFDNRPDTSFLQISTPINPGNSGGPAINIAEKVLGVNTFIIDRAQGLGFALLSNHVTIFLEKLKDQVETLLNDAKARASQPTHLTQDGTNYAKQKEVEMYTQEEFGKDFIRIGMAISAMDDDIEQSELACMLLLLSYWISDPVLLENLAQWALGAQYGMSENEMQELGKRIIYGLNDEQKEQLLIHMIAIAKINGVLHPKEVNLLRILSQMFLITDRTLDILEQSADYIVKCISLIR